MHTTRDLQQGRGTVTSLDGRQGRFTNQALTELFSASAIASLKYRTFYRRVLSGLVSTVLRPTVGTSDDPESLVAWFTETAAPKESMSVDEYLRYLEQHVLPHSINMYSPRCMGHMSSVLPAFALMLTNLVVGINQNLVKREASKSFALIERQAAGIFHRLIYGFPRDFYDQHVHSKDAILGIMASGGTLANITALWIARNRCLGRQNGFAGVEKEGMRAALDHYGYADAVLIGSKLMHYSVDKAAALLGVGERNVMRVPVDDSYRVDIGKLRRMIDRCILRKQCVLAVIGVAGTTDCGSVDPLAKMGSVARDARMHFHVDAAWGASLLFSNAHRSKLTGIEQADSVTVDGHKQLYMPLGTSMLVLRDPAAAKVIEKEARYMLQPRSGDLGKCSVEGSRPGRALLMHAAVHIIGHHGYEILVDENLRKADYMAALVRSRPEFELLCDPQTNIVLYRYVPIRLRHLVVSGRLRVPANSRINDLNERIQNAQYRAGRTFVSRTVIEKSFGLRRLSVVALRAVIGNPLTTEEDIAAVLADQLQIVTEIEQRS